MFRNQGYDDIIDLPHHVSSTHPPLSREKRAAQFSPFAALSGYGDCIDEAARFTDRKIDLVEDQRGELDAKLRRAIACNGSVDLTVFTPDGRKGGGSYKTLRARIEKVDEYDASLVLEDGSRVLVGDVVRIEFPNGLER